MSIEVNLRPSSPDADPLTLVQARLGHLVLAHGLHCLGSPSNNDLLLLLYSIVVAVGEN